MDHYAEGCGHKSKDRTMGANDWTCLPILAARLTKHIQIVTEGFQLPRALPAEAVFDSSFLPPLAERRVQ